MSGTQIANVDNENVPGNVDATSTTSSLNTVVKEKQTTPLCSSVEEYQNNPCLELLSKAGVVFIKVRKNSSNSNGSNSSSSIDSKRQFACKSSLSIFEQSVETLLKKSMDRGEQFVSSIREYINMETENLLHFIEPLYVANQQHDNSNLDCDNATSNNHVNFNDAGSSLFRTLLKFETVQTSLIDVLLETMAIQAGNDNGSDDDENESNSNDGKNLIKIILSQLQWIEHVYNNRKLTNKLLECLDICPIEAQRDIIAMIPDIIDDNEQESVVEKLFDIMENEITLTVSVLDSISNLYLYQHLLFP